MSAPAAGLRRFLTDRPPRRERCELCADAVPGEHRHLVDTEARALVCACTACAVLMEQPGAAAGRFRTVPARYLTDPGHRLDARAWEALQIPVGVAFVLRNTALDRLAVLYPSPAGATESELEPAVFDEVLGATRLAALLEPDTEALLLRRTGDHCEVHLVPVDVAYGLVGRMRLLWQGFDGGAEARTALDDFFDGVRRRATPLDEAERP